MSNRTEALIRDAAPQVSRTPDVFLAALNVSDEAAKVARPVRRRKGLAVGAVLTGVLVLSGGAVAVAATQSLWWTAPYEVNSEGNPATDSTEPFSIVRFIPSASYANGVDDDSEEAQRAFRLAQQWLLERPFTAPVPAESQTITEADREQWTAAVMPNSELLRMKATRATSEVIVADVKARGDEVESRLREYLAGQGVDPALIVVDFTAGVFEVDQ